MTRQLRTHGGSGGRALTSGLLLFACLAAHGCKGDDPEKVTTPRPHRDAEVEDGGRDASVDPGDAETEAGRGGSGGRGAVGGRGGSNAGEAGEGGSSGEAGDGGGGNPDAGDASTDPNIDPCELSDDDNTFMTAVPFSDEGRFAVTTGTTGFGVLYQGESDIGCGAGGNLFVLPVQASGAFVTPKLALPECSLLRDMSLLHVADGWRVVWSDNSEGGFELHSLLLAENMVETVDESRRRLTSNSLVEQRPTLAHLGSAPLLAYIAVNNAAKTTRVSTLRLTDDATPQDVIPESAGRKPTAIALMQIGDENGALAWVDEEGKPGVWIQPTDLNGAAQGEPVLLNDAVTAGTTVDLAARDSNQGGAVLYSLALGGSNHEVRFRRLGATGQVLADELKVIGQPLQGRDASFARLGGGYAVAYRALPGGPITQPEIRLTFITKEGFVMRDGQDNVITYKIADAVDGGGRTTLRVSTDGQLLIGYVDGAEDGEQLRLVRKRLDCAL